MNSIIVVPERKPEALPILPGSCGRNSFRRSGLMEDMPGIDAVEICTVARGKCEIDQQGRPVLLTAGQSLYKLPHENRRKLVISPDGAEIYWVTFRGAYATEFMTSYGYPAGALPTGHCPVELYDEISRNLLIGTDTAFRRTIALIAELIALLPGPEPEPEASDRLFAQILQRIRRRVCDADFNVECLAVELGLHRTTLLRIFRKKLDTTPTEYLTRCRIDNARRMLRTTLFPVAEVAESSGFRQSSYFCKVFRKKCGQTPEQYRRNA